MCVRLVEVKLCSFLHSDWGECVNIGGARSRSAMSCGSVTVGGCGFNRSEYYNIIITHLDIPLHVYTTVGVTI